MKRYTLTKEWIKSHDDLIKRGYTIALENHYDYSYTQDVLKILKEIDPDNATTENAQIFSQVLKLIDYTTQKKFNQKDKKEEKNS